MDAKDAHNYSPARFAFEQDNHKMLSFLRSAGADLDFVQPRSKRIEDSACKMLMSEYLSVMVATKINFLAHVKLASFSCFRLVRPNWEVKTLTWKKFYVQFLNMISG